jgi:hypothetical protein
VAGLDPLRLGDPAHVLNRLRRVTASVGGLEVRVHLRFGAAEGEGNDVLNIPALSYPDVLFADVAKSIGPIEDGDTLGGGETAAGHVARLAAHAAF